ncbi:MAG: hypothetical protein WCB26_09410, partial [Pseudolabrys sp.]
DTIANFPNVMPHTTIRLPSPGIRSSIHAREGAHRRSVRRFNAFEVSTTWRVVYKRPQRRNLQNDVFGDVFRQFQEGIANVSH